LKLFSLAELELGIGGVEIGRIAFLGLVAKCLPKDMHVPTPGEIVFRWAGGGET